MQMPNCLSINVVSRKKKHLVGSARTEHACEMVDDLTVSLCHIVYISDLQNKLKDGS